MFESTQVLSSSQSLLQPQTNPAPSYAVEASLIDDVVLIRSGAADQIVIPPTLVEDAEETLMTVCGLTSQSLRRTSGFEVSSVVRALAMSVEIIGDVV